MISWSSAVMTPRKLSQHMSSEGVREGESTERVPDDHS